MIRNFNMTDTAGMLSACNAGSIKPCAEEGMQGVLCFTGIPLLILPLFQNLLHARPHGHGQQVLASMLEGNFPWGGHGRNSLLICSKPSIPRICICTLQTLPGEAQLRGSDCAGHRCKHQVRRDLPALPRPLC